MEIAIQALLRREAGEAGDAGSTGDIRGGAADTLLFLLFDQSSSLQLTALSQRHKAHKAHTAHSAPNLINDDELWRAVIDNYIPARLEKATKKAKAWLAGGRRVGGGFICLGLSTLTCGEGIDILHAADRQLEEAREGLASRDETGIDETGIDAGMAISEKRRREQRESLRRFIRQASKEQEELWKYLSKQKWGPLPQDICRVFQDQG